MRVGVEVGGTFTDLVSIGPDGIRVTKVPSTPASPDEGAFDALVESGLDLDATTELAHGSTVATNAVLERKGFRTAFITTTGFRDLLFMQRHGRSRIYDLEYQKPAPVVERADCLEVRERLDAGGAIVTPLDIDAIASTLIPQLREAGYEAVAVCLLNAYANPVHELALRQAISEALPDLTVSLSHEVTREFREYERASTTTLSAYVQPVIDRYIARFEARLAEGGFDGGFSVMQSNGGRLPATAMRTNAVNALLSGPAAGVIGAARQAGRAGYGNLLTFDMGGTSTDVSVVTDGKPQLTTEFEIDGLPVRVPLIDIHTIGAGGGSIVWVDDGGMLRVGPRSAGAVPGPACYGKLRDRADADRCPCHPPDRPGGGVPGRAHGDRRGRCPAQAFRPGGGPLRHVAGGGRRQRRAQLAERQCRARDPADLHRARARPARLCADAVRRVQGPLHAAHVAEELGGRGPSSCRRARA